MDKLLDNHGTSHIERQTDEGEHEMESPIFRLATPCVSAHREARYSISSYSNLFNFFNLYMNSSVPFGLCLKIL